MPPTSVPQTYHFSQREMEQWRNIMAVLRRAWRTLWEARVFVQMQSQLQRDFKSTQRLSVGALGAFSCLELT